MSDQFEFFKHSIPISQVAESLGYTFNKKKGKGRYKEYTHPDQPNIIITQHHQYQLYFTRNDDRDKGSVIDFVKNRLHMFNVSNNNPYDGVNKVLSSLSAVPYVVPPQQAKEPVRNKGFSMDDYHIRKPDAHDLRYLTSNRKISPRVLSDFLTQIYLVKKKDIKGKKPFWNIGFPMTNPISREIKGFELVNYNWKQITAGTDKQRAAWISEQSDFPRNIVFGESAIDLISFHQLHGHQIPSPVYVSTGGQFSANQVLGVVKAYPNAKLHSAFDNDLHGHLYDIRLAAVVYQMKLGVERKEGQIRFSFGSRQFSMPEDQVSLANFRKLANWKRPLISHKSKTGDFNDDLKETKANKKSTLTP